MDNNNSIPYGSIPSLNDQFNTLSNQRHYTQPQSVPANNNLQDPVAVARNLNPSIPSDRPIATRLRANYINKTCLSNSWSGNEGQDLPFTNQIVGEEPEIIGVQTLPPIVGYPHSLIKHEPIRLSPNSRESSNGTRAGNLCGINRYFQAPWSVNGITHVPHTYRPLDHVSGRPLVQLPTLTEQNPTQPIVYPENPTTVRSSKKHPGIKRRVSKDESEDGLPRPATKLLLTEEKMAAKMHNLSISNDHGYHVNGLPTQLDLTEPNRISDSVLESASDDEDGNNEVEDDNNNMESANSPVFVLAAGVKEMMAKNHEIIPQSLLQEMVSNKEVEQLPQIDMLSKPCLAVIPWRPPDDVIGDVSFNFSNKTDDEKMAENEKNQHDSVKENQLFTFGNSNVDHTEMIDNYQTFEFDDDDMDL